MMHTTVSLGIGLEYEAYEVYNCVTWQLSCAKSIIECTLIVLPCMVVITLLLPNITDDLLVLLCGECDQSHDSH